jgi:hypothetical protein
MRRLRPFPDSPFARRQHDDGAATAAGQSLAVAALTRGAKPRASDCLQVQAAAKRHVTQMRVGHRLKLAVPWAVYIEPSMGVQMGVRSSCGTACKLLSVMELPSSLRLPPDHHSSRVIHRRPWRSMDVRLCLAKTPTLHELLSGRRRGRLPTSTFYPRTARVLLGVRGDLGVSMPWGYRVPAALSHYSATASVSALPSRTRPPGEFLRSVATLARNA